ncbi:MAG: hypothetical protein CME59_11185 [Halioglobus sp.]|nr:hypothetical protein [Halioglobus sp.]|tara:strand:+ start:771 stop:1214 length:444 start_codon:yes stop_codon:yes gene_type:complete
MRVLPGFAVLFALALSACGGIEFLDKGEGYNPGADPLVQAHFERLLNEQEIAYQRDYQGNYRAIKKNQQDNLERIGARAQSLEPGRESLRVSPGCAADRLKAYLLENDALYVVSREQEGAFVQMTESDFAQLAVAARYQGFQEDCVN